MKKVITLILLTTIYQLLATNIVFADDMGQTKTANTTISAFIGPQPHDYQFSLGADDNPPAINNGKYYDFTITYGAKQSAKVNTANTVIIFDWSQALAPNNQNVFAYVYGSASEVYGGAKPVIDTGNKTVTWTIANLPPGTIDQTVGLQLFANSYDKTTTAFPLYLTASMTNQYVTMPDQTLTENYQYQTPPPGPTATPGPQPTGVPTPTPTPQPPAYSVAISGITNNSATIHTTTTYPTQLTINYGTSPGNLTQSVSNNTFQKENFTTLTNLKSDTPYYFSLTFTYENGQTRTTEIYTFKTATQALSSLPLTGTAVISSGGFVLLSEVMDKNMSPGNALLTATSPYDVTISLPQDATYKTLEVLVEQDLSTTSVAMSKQQPGIYTAHMSSLGPGRYNIVLRTVDDTGTLIEYKLAQMRVIPPLFVTDKDTGSPIANARINLLYFDQNSKAYKSIQGLFGSHNPGYTDENGIYAITLPPGKYRADASALMYDQTTVDFTLGQDDGQDFTHIVLKKDIFNITVLFSVGMDYAGDLINTAYHTLLTIASSIRAFNLFAIVVTGSFALVSWLLFMLRSHSTWKYLPIFFLFHFDVMLKRHRSRYIYGKVTDSQGMPLSFVRVELEDADSKTILRHTTTNKSGQFYFTHQFTSPVNLIFTKEGYKPTTKSIETGAPEKGLEIKLATGTPHHRSAFGAFKTGLGDILGLFFEASLVLSLILEILFFLIYGLEKTLPFFALSLINIILWFFYLHQRSQKSVI